MEAMRPAGVGEEGGGGSRREALIRRPGSCSHLVNLPALFHFFLFFFTVNEVAVISRGNKSMKNKPLLFITNIHSLYKGPFVRHKDNSSEVGCEAVRPLG